jgi:hypothetical protein
MLNHLSNYTIERLIIAYSLSLPCFRLGSSTIRAVGDGGIQLLIELEFIKDMLVIQGDFP